MNKKNLLLISGFILYIVLTGIDRFVYEVPNIIYFPLAIAGLVLVIAGAVLNNKKRV